MTMILLIIIYISFISLGLPDSLIGSSWPMMHLQLDVPLSYAGILSTIVAVGTIISSFLSGKLISKLGTGKVTAISVAMTAFALFGFYASPGFIWLCFVSVPLGLGAGAVDSGLNNYVAIHYKALHMNWLHCFWGVGATSGPIIISAFTQGESAWRYGYLTIALIQTILVIILFATLPIWNKVAKRNGYASEKTEPDSEKQSKNILKIPGVIPTLLSFFCYCGLEFSTGLWGSSFLVNSKGVLPNIAARYVSMFYGGITIGRFISGIIALRFTSRQLIKFGQVICCFGVVLLLLPFPAIVSVAGLLFIGLGCAPIFPCTIHDTPQKFGPEVSQNIMGKQMAFAYIGTTLIPPVLGILVSKLSTVVFPYYLLMLLAVMIISSEITYKIVKKTK